MTDACLNDLSSVKRFFQKFLRHGSERPEDMLRRWSICQLERAAYVPADNSTSMVEAND